MSLRNPCLTLDYLVDGHIIHHAKKDSWSIFGRKYNGLFSDMLSFTYLGMQWWRRNPAWRFAFESAEHVSRLHGGKGEFPSESVLREQSPGQSSSKQWHWRGRHGGSIHYRKWKSQRGKGRNRKWYSRKQIIREFSERVVWNTSENSNKMGTEDWSLWRWAKELGCP